MEFLQGSVSSTQTTSRIKWSNNVEFIFASIGYFGLFNMWSLCFMSFLNGGGAFFALYTILLFVYGLPFLFLESSLAQFISNGPVGVFKIIPCFSSIGYILTILNVIFTTFCVVILSYWLNLMYHAFSSELPWHDCGNAWNTDRCVDIYQKISSNRTFEFETRRPFNEFFHSVVLEISNRVDEPGGIVGGIFVCCLITWIFAYFCASKGLESIRRIIYFTATIPVVILFIIFIRLILMPGSFSGIMLFFYSDFSHLLYFRTWFDAFNLVFYTFHSGFGGVMILSSYNDFEANLKRDVLIITILYWGISFIFALTIYAIFGTMAHSIGSPISEVIYESFFISFIPYPEVFGELFGPLWTILYLIMLYLFGLHNIFISIDLIKDMIWNKFPTLNIRKEMLTIYLCGAMFFLSLVFTTHGGIYYITLMERYFSSFSIIIVCMLEIIIFGYCYGYSRLFRDIEFMTKTKLSLGWKISWIFTIPFILTILFFCFFIYYVEVSYEGIAFPGWLNNMAFVGSIIPFGIITIHFLIIFILQSGTWKERLCGCFNVSINWCPRDIQYRSEWYELIDPIDDTVLEDL